MFIILKKHWKEWFCVKSNIISSFLILFIVGIILPIFFESNASMYTVIIGMMMFSQISSQLFVGEKENKTFEAFLTMPVSMKKLYFSKVFFCFSFAIFFQLCAMVLSSIVFFIKDGFGSSHLSLYVIAIFFLVTLPTWNFSMHTVTASIKSRDMRVFSMYISFLTIPYIIFAGLISFTFSVEDVDSMVKVVILALYLSLNFIVFIVHYLSTKKYFSKPFLFENLNK